MNIAKLETILKAEPGFRLKQAMEAIYKQLMTDWSQALNFPQKLRKKLNKECPLEIKAQVLESRDKKTIKAQITLSDGLKIETVLLRHKDRNTVCVSSQVGCALGCLFCATGQQGFKRNLLVWEIVEQVIFFARYLKEIGDRVDNLVFMGMGEPFLNYDNVLEAIKLLNSKDTLNLGARHISISTIGIIPGMQKLAKEKLQINLAISLHASDDYLRTKIIPVNKKYYLKNLIDAVGDYLKITKRQVMFEYIMIERFNDSMEQAMELADLLKHLPKHLYIINLIQYNPTKGFNPSSELAIKNFKAILDREGIKTTIRLRLGREVKGACGQLVADLEK
ncbi:MAG: 23S rRNA (adenine(2503)-C(2))-methyltransferase [Candidatus Buchananbacteria bacterium RBG_13_36_9]|uniref:Probable dual-specificity RNA methyltransferase RlmN n=1 Tax=Candidatus Buchananbacteria bacterium RBG_13_36_9 TaxID=1797530 RepID=A0A1G1XQW6_9BACT|nr:MAG: 23S rRNA (adenine(2503)-C(2))-methyltransferase [Candidatus Buchananbacteria bacterium RBG_13_36_9]